MNKLTKYMACLLAVTTLSVTGSAFAVPVPGFGMGPFFSSFGQIRGMWNTYVVMNRVDDAVSTVAGAAAISSAINHHHRRQRGDYSVHSVPAAPYQVRACHDKGGYRYCKIVTYYSHPAPHQIKICHDKGGFRYCKIVTYNHPGPKQLRTCHDKGGFRYCKIVTYRD